MSPEISMTADDEGKTVIDETGDEIGRVVEVENGRAYVDPDPSVTDTVMSKLGWGSRDGGSYLLENEAIETVTDDEVRLRSL
mgnify:CR=1 FL=1|jgi:hypothetical protein